MGCFWWAHTPRFGNQNVFFPPGSRLLIKKRKEKKTDKKLSILIQELQHKRSIQKSHFYSHSSLYTLQSVHWFSDNVLILGRHLQVYKHNKFNNCKSIVYKTISLKISMYRVQKKKKLKKIHRSSHVCRVASRPRKHFTWERTDASVRVRLPDHHHHHHHHALQHPNKSWSQEGGQLGQGRRRARGGSQSDELSRHRRRDWVVIRLIGKKKKIIIK